MAPASVRSKSDPLENARGRKTRPRLPRACPRTLQPIPSNQLQRQTPAIPNRDPSSTVHSNSLSLCIPAAIPSRSLSIVLLVSPSHVRKSPYLCGKCKLTSISGWSVGTFIDVAVLHDVESPGVRSGVPMKKASAPSTRQAKARTLANIIVISGDVWVERSRDRDVARGMVTCTCAAKPKRVAGPSVANHAPLVPENSEFFIVSEPMNKGNPHWSELRISAPISIYFRFV